jgi:hypothetical protein
MTRDEIADVIKDTPTEEVGDVLIELAIAHWTEAGYSPNDIRVMVDMSLEDSEDD